MPAKLDDTFIWPQLNKVNGIAFENKPIPKQCKRILFPFLSETLGNWLPVKIHNANSNKAAKTILKVAIVSGV